MKGLLYVLLLLLMSCDTSETTDRLLAEVWSKDQNIRQQMTVLTKAVTAEGRMELVDSLMSVCEEVERIDAENMMVVDSILQRGLPKGLSPESYKTIWIVIDHASLDKQEAYLPLIEQMSINGLIDNDEYAILFDRIAMKNNRPQRYGSQSVQFGKVDNLQLYIWPVEDADRLDSLRVSVGMQSIAEYLQQLTTTTGVKARYEPQLSVEQINEAVRNALDYDDYRYQRENGILITEEFRAEGMHKILYQCPHCMAESKMASKGSELYCCECGKRWRLNEDGTLSALSGETEFAYVPNWFLWEREQVKKQIEKGEYHFEDEVEVFSMPRCWKFEKLGAATLSHDAENGFVLKGKYNGAEYYINRRPIDTNSLHIEYDYCYLRPEDCVDISTENDSFYCYPKKQNVVTKLAFATEILYQKQREKALTTVKK